MERKRRLARLVVTRFHDERAADEAEAHFNRVTRDRQAPTDVPDVTIEGDAVHIPALLVDGLGVASRGEARRLIAQGGVSRDGERLTELDLRAEALEGRILRAGKRRYARIVRS